VYLLVVAVAVLASLRRPHIYWSENVFSYSSRCVVTVFLG